MNYTYFDTKEGLIKLLTDFQDIFTLLDEISGQLLQGFYSTSEDYKKILNQATGIYGSLEPLYSLAIATKENAELKAREYRLWQEVNND